MAKSPELIPAKVVLLAVHYAANVDIRALRILTALYRTVLKPDLVLRILLTYLPESTEPALYVPYIQDLSHANFTEAESTDIDISAVEKLTDGESRKKIRKLELLPLEYPQASHETSEDSLTLFLLLRAHKIDEETGLLPLLPQLLEPFIEHSDTIRTWMISTLLPLLRFNYEYYPHDEPKLSLEVFERLGANVGASILLSKAGNKAHDRREADKTVARDLRGLVGPWMYGNIKLKRGRVPGNGRRTSLVARLEESRSTDGGFREADSEEPHYWGEVYNWLLSQAAEDFSIVTHAVEHWGGPGDVDLGGYDDERRHLDEATEQVYKAQYAQAAIAAIYTTKDSSRTTLEATRGILVRIAEMMNLPRPPALDIAAPSLPEIALPADVIDRMSSSLLLTSALLLPSNVLTTPNEHSVTFLFALVLSAFTLGQLGASFCVRRVAELYLLSNGEAQKVELQRVIRNTASGQRKNDKEWLTIRASLLWLWGWGREDQDYAEQESDKVYQGAGVFGRVEKIFLEAEILRAFLSGARMSAFLSKLTGYLTSRVTLTYA